MRLFFMSALALLSSCCYPQGKPLDKDYVTCRKNGNSMEACAICRAPTPEFSRIEYNLRRGKYE